MLENVRTGHGPLGAEYPAWLYIMEGNTPSLLYLIDNRGI
ncbi:MAG: nucleoside hydrolase-like domain-containing protein [bacterium]